MVWHQNGGVYNVAHKVVEHLVGGEALVATAGRGEECVCLQ
jgi:hypothetical protein